MFEEIEKKDKKLPNIKELSKEIKNANNKYGMYRISAAIILIVGIIFGIVMGNKYTSCSSMSSISETCIEETFNFGLMIIIVFASSIISLVLSALGKIIELLSSINEKLSKNSKKSQK